MSGFSDPWEAARFRSRVYTQIRTFFLERNYLEVETPHLSPDLIPESSIEIFKTVHIDFAGREKELYLVPSPEVWMKKLLSFGSGSIFQICKCFRNSEQSGRLHNNEFTMLEWYGTNLDYRDNIALTEELFRDLAALACDEHRHFFSDPFLVLTMEEAFAEYAGFSLEEADDVPSMRRELEKRDLPWDGEDSMEALFNRLFLNLVEPELPEQRTVVLTDYPAYIPTLARQKNGTPWSERWEMYVKGIELANCYTEERDPEKVKAYYDAENREKQSALVPHNTDGNYADYFHSDYPAVSGNAMGMDRLIMALSGADRIGDVVLFPLVP